MTDEIKAIRQNFHAAYQMYTMGYHSAPIVFDALMATPDLLTEIDRLNTELASYQQIKNRLQTEGFEDLDTMISRYKQVMADSNEIDIAKDEKIEQLQAELLQKTQQLSDLKDSGFCGSCTGCNAPHDPNRTTWCNDWAWRGPQEGLSTI